MGNKKKSIAIITQQSYKMKQRKQMVAIQLKWHETKLIERQNVPNGAQMHFNPWQNTFNILVPLNLT